MRKLDPASLRVRASRDLGTTREVLTVPAGAEDDAFDVRIDLLALRDNVALDRYPGVDRTVFLAEGDAVVLEGPPYRSAPCTLDRASPLLSFSGDDPYRAELVSGGVLLLDVMTRRGSRRQRASVLNLEVERILGASELTLVLVLYGQAVFMNGASCVVLNGGDVLLLGSREERRVGLPLEGKETRVLRVDVERNDVG